MPDRTIAGSAPGPDAASMPPGTIWIQVIERAADATGKTVKVNVYCTNMCRHIGVNLAGPEQDMVGGPFIVDIYPTAWEYPPSGGAPGLVLTADTVIAKPNFYNIEAQCADLRGRVTCQIGKVGPEQVGPYYNSADVLANTYLGRQQVMKDEIRDMARPTGILGGPGKKMKRTQGKTTQR